MHTHSPAHPPHVLPPPRLLLLLLLPQVLGPTRSAREARKQQQKYGAAKEALGMLGRQSRAGNVSVMPKTNLGVLLAQL